MLKVNEKFVLNDVPYILLEYIKESDGFDNNWYGYKIKNLKTGEIETMSRYRVDEKSLSLRSLNNEKINIMERISEIEEKISELNNIFNNLV